MKHWSKEQIHELAGRIAFNCLPGYWPFNKATERDPYAKGAPTRFYYYIRIKDRVWTHFGEPSNQFLYLQAKAERYRLEQNAVPGSFVLAEVDRSNLLFVSCRLPNLGINTFRIWKSPLLQEYHTKTWGDLCRFRWITGKQTKKYRFKPAFEIQEKEFMDKWKSLPIEQQLEENF